MAERKEKPLMLQHQRPRREGAERIQLMNYNTDKNRSARRALIILLLAIAIAGVACIVTMNQGAAEDQLVKVWVLCKPGSQVIVRRTPSKRAMEVGQLEVGDWFMTDAVSSNGYIRAYGIGEYGEGWIYAGFVATEEPVPVFTTYCCVAKNRVACRRWMDGPQTSNPWLRNGSDVQVFHIAGEWACTSRGYIRSEWLEPDPS